MKALIRNHDHFAAILFISFLLTSWILFLAIGKGAEVYVINGLHNRFLDHFFTVITNFGNGVIFIPFVVVFLFSKVYVSMALVTEAISHGVIVSIFKRILFAHADRPIAYLNRQLLYFIPNIDVHTSMSFPSGHSTTIFGLAVFLALYYKNKFLTVALFFLAVLVGISRIYLVQHFGLDVTAGAFIGTITGIITYHSFESLPKPDWMRQGIQIRNI
jgi:membrane-associated phospholipid phosphatase